MVVFCSEKNRPPRVLFIGAVFQDVILSLPHFVEEDTKLRALGKKDQLGGNCVNIIKLMRSSPIPMKDDICLLAPLPSREVARPYLEELDKYNVDIRGFYFPEVQSFPQAFVLTTPHSRTCISYMETPDLTIDHINPANLRNYDWIHLEGRSVPLIHTLFTQEPYKSILSNCTVSMEIENPNREGLEDLIGYPDVIFFSKAWATKFMEKCGRPKFSSSRAEVEDFFSRVILKARPTAHLFLTLGSSGAWTASRNMRPVHVSARSVPHVVDTVGAGDAFASGVIWSLLHQEINPILSAAVGSWVAGGHVAAVENPWSGIEADLLRDDFYVTK